MFQVARRGAKLGMPAPMLIQLEREIDREIAADKKKLGFSDNEYYDADLEDDLSDSDDEAQYGPLPQIVTNDLKSLDEMVSDHFIRNVKRSNKMVMNWLFIISYICMYSSYSYVADSRVLFFRKH